MKLILNLLRIIILSIAMFLIVKYILFDSLNIEIQDIQPDNITNPDNNSNKGNQLINILIRYLILN